MWRAAGLGQCSGMTPERLLLLGVVLALLDDLDELGRAVANEKGGGVLGDRHFLASPRLWGVRTDGTFGCASVRE